MIDKPWRKDNSAPIFLIFDALIVNSVNVISSPFHKRLVDANTYVAQRFLPVRGTLSKPVKLPAIDIYMKEMFHIWDARELFGALIESDKLEHENDGLIFTVDQCPYYPGTCEQILKWKPIELNSIDFILNVSPVEGVYELRTADNLFFSYAVFNSGSESIGSCVECVYDKEKDDQLQRKVNFMVTKQLPITGLAELDENSVGSKGGWRVLRPRTDKGGNPMVVAQKIWQTISGYDIRLDLKETLSEITPSYFKFKTGGKRSRSSSEMDVKEYDD